MKKRDTFIFYRSIFESAQMLNEKDRLEFYEAVMGFSLNFKKPPLEGMPEAMFTLIEPTLDKSNKGYIAGKKNTPDKHPPRVATKHPTDNKDKDKDKDIKKQVKKDFTFNLSNKHTFDNLSEEYVLKLNEYIIKQPYDLTFEHFRNSCLASGYKYKNFSLAYLGWAKKDSNQDKQPQGKQHYAEKLGYIV